MSKASCSSSSLRRASSAFAIPYRVCPADDAASSSEDRVRKGAEKLSKFLNAKQQGRLDGFFSSKPKEAPAKGKEEAKGKGKGTKRKVRHIACRGEYTEPNVYIAGG